MYTFAAKNGWLWNLSRLNANILELEGDKLRQPLNFVVVNEESHFPLQDATTITLQTGYTYFLGSTITTSKRFIVQDGVGITSGNTFTPSLIYTGTLPMFTTSTANWLMTDMTVVCPNATVFELSGGGIFILDTVAIVSPKKVANCVGTGDLSINWNNVSLVNITADGLTFSGNLNVLSLSKVTFVATSPTHKTINLGTAVFNTIELENINVYSPSGAVTLTGASNSANLVAGSVATVQSCFLGGTGVTPLSGISILDIRWDFRGNGLVEDTLEDALIYFNGNTAQTVITATSNNGANAVNINATWLSGRTSKFSATAGGEITYLGERPVTVPIDVSINVLGTTGVAQDAHIYLYKNNVVIPATKRGDTINNTKSKQLYLPWQITLAQGDVLRVKIENSSGINNLICEQGIFRVR